MNTQPNPDTLRRWITGADSLTMLSALRYWQKAVDDNTATGEMAVLLQRRVRELSGDLEANSFAALALAYARDRQS